MVGSYEILDGNRIAGTVQITREGLYYHFSGRCGLLGTDVCRLQVSCGEVQENLGVLVPVDGEFGLEKKIPIRRLGEGVPQFTVQRDRKKNVGKFVPIYPEEPFGYMERLKNAFLARQAGQLGVVIQE